MLSPLALANVPVDRTICFARAARSAGCSTGLYSIDAICVGSLWCGNTTPPMATPTKNIAASITTITPSFRGALSLRICLSKSSFSRRSIFTSPIFIDAKRNKTAAVPLTSGNNSEFLNFRPKDKYNQHRVAESRGQSVSWQSPVPALVAQLHVDRCNAQRPLGLWCTFLACATALRGSDVSF
jgi:hypothetical protein